MANIAIEDISDFLAQAIRKLGLNEEIVLTENQRPIARLTSLPSLPGRARRGSMKDMIIAIAPDFDATPEGFEDYMP